MGQGLETDVSATLFCFVTQTEASPPSSTFERELSEYLACLRLPAEHRDHAAQLCRSHDFSMARTHLIVSRPGRHSGVDSLRAQWPCCASVGIIACAMFSRWSLQPHPRCYDAPVGTGPKLSAYGHMAVRRLLGKESFADSFSKAPIVAQFSSLGSLNEEWLREFRESVASGLGTRGA